MRLPIGPSNQELILDECSPSPVQSPRSAPSSEQTLSPSHNMQSDSFLWPDVQELRTKYTPQSSKLSCMAPNGIFKCSTSRCQGCSNHYNSLFDLRSHRTEGLPKQSRGEEDSAQHRPPPALCRWSSLDHVLGSLPLHEVQNLPEPGGQVCPAARGDGAARDEEEGRQERADCATKSRSAECHLVRSLREKFQSLSASS